MPKETDPESSKSTIVWAYAKQVLSTARRPSIVLCLVLVGIFLAFRIFLLRADPPYRMPSGQNAQELVVEGPAKAHEARKWALFGSFSTNKVDNYQFWRAQSPAYVYPLAWCFRAFGVSYTTLRLFGIFTAALGFLTLLGLALRGEDKWWGVAATGVFIAANYYSILYCKAGLLEPLLNTFAALMMITALLACKKNTIWLVGVQWAFVLALLTKQSALFLVPLLIGVSIVAHRYGVKRREPWWHHAVVAGHGLIGLTLLILYMQTEPYMRTLEWNFGHMIVGKEKQYEMAFSHLPGAMIFERIFDWERFRSGMLYLFPATLPLIILQLSRTAVQIVTRRPNAVNILSASWFLCAYASLQMTQHVRVRFSLVLFPPAALLAGSAMAFLLKKFEQQQWRRDVVIALVLFAFGATHGGWYLNWALNTDHELARANELVRKKLDSRDVVVGAWAAPLMLESKADHFYVKGTFNTSQKALEALGITHLLVRPKDVIGRLVQRRLPHTKNGEELVDFQYRNRKYSLHKIE